MLDLGVPARSLEKQPFDVGALFRVDGDGVFILQRDHELPAENVDGNAVATRAALLERGQKARGEGETRQPKHFGHRSAKEVKW